MWLSLNKIVTREKESSYKPLQLLTFTQWRYIQYTSHSASCLYPWTQHQKTNILYNLYLSTHKRYSWQVQSANTEFMVYGWLAWHKLIPLQQTWTFFYFYSGSNFDYIRFNLHERPLLQPASLYSSTWAVTDMHWVSGYISVHPRPVHSREVYVWYVGSLGSVYGEGAQ